MWIAKPSEQPFNVLRKSSMTRVAIESPSTMTPFIESPNVDCISGTFIPGALVDPAGLGVSVRSSRYPSAVRRATILAAARQMIGELGCAQVKMRELAERSEVTPPTIYALIGNRHNVLFRALQEGLEVKFILAERRAASEGISPILAFAATELDSMEIAPGYYKNMTRGARFCELDTSSVRGLNETIGRRFQHWLETMRDLGQIRQDQCVPFSTVSKVLAHQLNIPVSNWASGNFGVGGLRSEMITAMTLPLIALATDVERDRMNDWSRRYT
jgi:AcrR family transcriptional regulator